MTQYFFTYGTLRLDNRHKIAEKLAAHSTLISLGYIKGAKLYEVDDFPALVRNSNPENIVVGDVYLLEDATLFKELDEYEGIGVGEPPYDYSREKVEVYCGEGKYLCWTYLYKASLGGNAVLIESGDYLNP